MLHHHKLLQNGSNIKIPFQRSIIKTHTLPAAITTTTIDNLFNGVLPKNMIICMIDNTAFTNKKKNPFNFQHFDLSYFAVYVNGQTRPFQPINFDFDQGISMLGYTNFLQNLNIYGQNQGLVIDHDDYVGGSFMIALNFSSNSGECVDLLEDGSLKFEFKFEKALVRAVTVVFYAEYDSMLEIDKNFEITTLL